MAAVLERWGSLVIMFGFLLTRINTQDTTDTASSRLFLNITSILVPPYLMERSLLEETTSAGNESLPQNATVGPNGTESTNTTLLVEEDSGPYVGYIKDLLDALAKRENFDYQLNIVRDGLYGSYVDGVWTGMIGEIVRGEADMAAAPMTITMEREEAVDFSNAFQSFNVKAVFKRRPHYKQPLLRTMKDLTIQETLRVGTTKYSGLVQALKDATETVPITLWAKMQPGDLQDNNNDGVTQARFSNDYAFLLDGASADYVLRREPCDLDYVEGDFYTRKYGLVVPNMSPLRDVLNRALVDMYNEGELDTLYTRWWGGDECNSAPTYRSLYHISIFLSVVIAIIMTRK